MELIKKYFSGLTDEQTEQFEQLESVYNEWNAKINVISRKDIGSLYEKHVLHSLAIAKFINFTPGSKILDVGTGGGFPGIPLAIFFPDVNFCLIDSIEKKIKVVNDIADSLNLENVITEQIRAENLKGEFDFVISRAVTKLSEFVSWIQKNISQKQQNSLPNGVIYLKGGNIDGEIKPFRKTVFVQNLSDYFEEDFYKTKKLVYMPFS